MAHTGSIEQPQIKVFITKTQEFRARIKEPGVGFSYEVTIGGDSWNSGKGKEFEAIIKKKCELLVTKLTTKLKTL